MPMLLFLEINIICGYFIHLLLDTIMKIWKTKIVNFIGVVKFLVLVVLVGVGLMYLIWQVSHPPQAAGGM